MIISKTKIETVKNPDGTQGYVWNPIIGCKNKCPWCYARKIARRFPAQFGNFDTPHWSKNYDKSFPKNPSMIFLSMSDYNQWDFYAWDYIELRMRLAKQHTFLVSSHSQHFLDFPANVWQEITINNYEESKNLYNNIYSKKTMKGKFVLSIEPMHSVIDISTICKVDPDWIIIGAETGNRKDKIFTDQEWIRPFFDLDTPLYMKNSLKSVCDFELRQEFPEGYLNE